MRETLPQILTAESLAKRPVEARMENYRAMHERFGSLMLAKVDSVGVDGIKVTLAASDMKRYPFIFTAQPGKPYRLAKVAMLEQRSGGHGGGHSH